MLGYTFRTSPTVGGAFERLVRYHRLLHDQSVMRLTVRGREARLSFQLFPEGTPRQQAEFSLALFLLFVRQATGRDVVPRMVEFSHVEPADVSEHRRIFRAPLRFRRPRPVLVLPRSGADSAPLAGRRRVARPTREAGGVPDGAPGDRGESGGAGPARGGGAVVRGDPTVQRVAREMGRSPRTLHRRMREAGTSFRTVVDGLREGLARSYLAEQRLAIAEAAYLLGFSEASAFHRSFKRWTGQTPSEYRRTRTGGEA